MIKIFHFLSDTNIGGAGRLICNQIKNTDTNIFQTTVVIPSGSRLIPYLKKLPCSVIEAEHGADVSFSIEGFFEFRHILRAHRPDIVHSHASLSSRLAALTVGIPCRIYTRHCAFEVSSIHKIPPIRWCVGLANGILSTSVIAVADAARQNLTDMGCDEKKIATVINGVEPIRAISSIEIDDICQKLGIERNNFVIGIIARLERYKGHTTFIKAARICRRKYPDFRFLIVGDGSEEKMLKSAVHALGLDGYVHICGFVDDIAKIFNIIDVNVNCSYGTETSSLSLSEGMSLGIPCIVSDYGGNTYMVKNEENGLIFPAENPDALAEAVIRLYRNKELYKKCSAGAYKRYCDELNARAMTEKISSIYLKEYSRATKKRRVP